MRELPRLALNFGVFLFATFCLIILQSSFRPLSHTQYFHWMPSPLNWLPVVVYLSLYRKPFEGITSIYLILGSLTVLTISELGYLWLTGVAIFIFCQAIKSRLFWNGPQYFVLMSFFSSFVCLIIQFFLNMIFYDQFAWPNVFLWILQAFLTTLPAWICFYLLNWLDHVTHKEALTEVTGGGLA